MTQKSAVTVLGLGSMGTAQARALLNRGHQVTIWNRTKTKAAHLVAEGAKLAGSPAEAVAASPLIIMCVRNCSVGDDILAEPGVADALLGKTFVQLSGAGTEQTYAQQAWVNKHGGRFIKGGIIAYPRSIGQPNAVILYAGDPIFEEHRETLSSLGGFLQFLGTDLSIVTGAHFALSSYMIGSLVHFFETATIARHYGVTMDTYYLLASLLHDEIQERIREGVQRVALCSFGGSLASIDRTIVCMKQSHDILKQIGIPTKMTAATAEQLELASARGGGDQDVSYLVEALWDARHT